MPNLNLRNALMGAAMSMLVLTGAPALGGEVHILTDSWSFHRDDGTGIKTPDEVPSDGWTQVSLPHTARIEDRIPTNAWQGTAFYKRSIVKTLKPGERAYLRFEGAMNVADVWLDGKHLGQHLGGYLPFTYDVTDALADGRGELQVRINNEDNVITGPKPLKDLDYIQYGGLYRGVSLTVKPAVHLTDEMWSDTPAGGGIFVTYPKADTQSATVRVKAEVYNSANVSRSVSVSHAIVWQGKTLATKQVSATLNAGERRHFEVDIEVPKPQLWSPKSPALYDLKTTVASGKDTDEAKTRIGIRRFAFNGDKLLINGEETFLRGVNRHQEYPYIGYALSDAANYRDALLIKRAGFDYVRLSHYPHSKSFMDAADELGLIVLDAIPGWQYFNKDPAFSTQAIKTCSDMIRRDRNHASVLAWECSLNETQMPAELMQALHSTVKTEYPGDQGWSAGWKPETYDIYLQARQHRIGHKEALPDKPLIVSEYGDWEYYAMNAGFNQSDWADLKPDDRSSRQLLGSGETRLLQMASNLAEAHDDNFNTKAFADGYWVMFDYGRGYAPDLEASGAMSIDRLPKFAEAFFRSQRPADESSPVWGGGAMVEIASYWNAESSPQVRVFSNAEEVELFLNGKSLGKKGAPSAKHPNLKNPPLTFDAGAFQPGELKAVAYIGGKAVAEDVLVTAGEATGLKLWIDDHGVKPTTGDTVFVRAQVVDASGRVVPVSGQEVTFTVTGGYDILGPSTVTTEAGIASLLVRVKADKGQIRATWKGVSEALK
ncbi:glycoside hydrolase family 2 protein [Asticcacaulis tiandongensis]|uniref:glycoside hydrolase family 2 protein n=1 Tax=Asticcacaulis tiandongensis TaxID=2565365 RepID=UPI00112B50CE|nr:glycoside hydrolase family 2 TIM barrel-domain containing protein [Asticcacaulis tiandongensis]